MQELILAALIVIAVFVIECFCFLWFMKGERCGNRKGKSTNGR